jgi:hypothetical protein
LARPIITLFFNLSVREELTQTFVKQKLMIGLCVAKMRGLGALFQQSSR